MLGTTVIGGLTSARQQRGGFSLSATTPRLPTVRGAAAYWTRKSFALRVAVVLWGGVFPVVAPSTVVPSSLFIPVAAAHDALMEATPAAGGTVSSFPREIVLRFSGVPRAAFNTVAVSRTNTGEILLTVEPQIEDQRITVPIPEHLQPGAGTYTVGYQITSSDGHSTRGKYEFTVAGDPIEEDVTATAPSAPSSAVSETSRTKTSAATQSTVSSEAAGQGSTQGPASKMTAGALIVAVLALLGVVALAVAARRRQAK